MLSAQLPLQLTVWRFASGGDSKVECFMLLPKINRSKMLRLAQCPACANRVLAAEGLCSAFRFSYSGKLSQRLSGYCIQEMVTKRG